MQPTQLPPPPPSQSSASAPQQGRRIRQGVPQSFAPFIRGKKKRPKKRSRQKGIRRDHRPPELRPAYLTVFPRPNS